MKKTFNLVCFGLCSILLSITANADNLEEVRPAKNFVSPLLLPSEKDADNHDIYKNTDHIRDSAVASIDSPRSEGAGGIGRLLKHIDLKIDLVDIVYTVGEKLSEWQKERWEEKERKEQEEREKQEWERKIQDSDKQYREWRKECKKNCQELPNSHNADEY